MANKDRYFREKIKIFKKKKNNCIVNRYIFFYLIFVITYDFLSYCKFDLLRCCNFSSDLYRRYDLNTIIYININHITLEF